MLVIQVVAYQILRCVCDKHPIFSVVSFAIVFSQYATVDQHTSLRSVTKKGQTDKSKCVKCNCSFDTNRCLSMTIRNFSKLQHADFKYPKIHTHKMVTDE